MWLVHPEERAVADLRSHTADYPRVVVHHCRFEDLPPHDCFVTAGNSYGLMSAGIDAVVASFFGEEVVRAVEDKILGDYLGEQPVGTAFLVETGSPACPFLCHAPTMRTPGSIDGSDKVYVATWAALLEIYRHNLRHERPLRRVAFPAMGTGFGAVPFAECARQMMAAYHHFCHPPHRSLDWDWVTSRQRRICYAGDRQVCR